MTVDPEVLAAVERADSLAQATGDALDIAACAVLAGSAGAYRELEKVRELHRIALFRLKGLVRRLGHEDPEVKL